MNKKNEKKSFVILLLILCFSALPTLAKKSSNIRLDYSTISGPYLGQELPGTKPIVFAPGIVSTFMREGTAVVSPDGKEIFYPVYIKKDQKGGGLIGTIVTLKEKNGVWTYPKVASFSGLDNDAYITMHPNGKMLYFNSNRKTRRKDIKDGNNIWFVKKTKNGWSKANPMEPPINGDGDVSDFSVTKNGTAYFTKFKSKWSKIFRSKYVNGKYQQPEELPKIINCTENSQFDSYISPNEDYMIIPVYNRKDSFGSTDLYVSFRNKKNRWSQLINLGPLVNNIYGQGSASISPDGKYIFFSNSELIIEKPKKCQRTYEDLLKAHARPEMHHGVPSPCSDVYWISSKFVQDLKPKNFR